MITALEKFKNIKDNPKCLYYEFGLNGISYENTSQLFFKCDEQIRNYKRWIKNWTELRNELVSEVLKHFTKEELESALSTFN